MLKVPLKPSQPIMLVVCVLLVLQGVQSVAFEFLFCLPWMFMPLFFNGHANQIMWMWCNIEKFHFWSFWFYDISC